MRYELVEQACSFAVLVFRPGTTLVCPAPLLTTLPSVAQSGMQVNYQLPLLADPDATGVFIVLSPGNATSGSFFPIGNTKVSFQATNSVGAPLASCSFNVRVAAV